MCFNVYMITPKQKECLDLQFGVTKLVHGQICFIYKINCNFRDINFYIKNLQFKLQMHHSLTGKVILHLISLCSTIVAIKV